MYDVVRVVLFVLVLVWTGSDQLLAADGELDLTFGTRGRVTTNFPSGRGSATAVVLQPDGKVVVAGWTHYTGGDFAVARYNSDGSFDNTFGSGGKTTTDFGGTDLALAIALQADGKIVV